MNQRVDIHAILGDPVKRRTLMVRTIIATQAREGVQTSQAQAEAAYDKVLMDLSNEQCRCEPFTDHETGATFGKHDTLTNLGRTTRCAPCAAEQELRGIGYVRDPQAANWWKRG